MGGDFTTYQPQVVVKTRCPAVPEYDAATVVAAGQEMKSLRATNPAAKSPVLIRDYVRLRAKCRAYENK